MNSNVQQFVDNSVPFLKYLHSFVNNLPSLDLGQVVTQAPDRVTMIAVDINKGFCLKGSLASSRAANIVAPAADLLTRAYDLGVRHFIMALDQHQSNSLEFASFPPHCLAGSDETELVDELANLPFRDSFQLVYKPSVNSYVGTNLEKLLVETNPQTIVLMGDATDLCLYNLAVHTKHLAIARHQDWRIIVPASVVDTFDTPLEAAQQLNCLPHNAELIQAMFLYHMQLNGIEVAAHL